MFSAGKRLFSSFSRKGGQTFDARRCILWTRSVAGASSGISLCDLDRKDTNFLLYMLHEFQASFCGTTRSNLGGKYGTKTDQFQIRKAACMSEITFKRYTCNISTSVTSMLDCYICRYTYRKFQL